MGLKEKLDYQTDKETWKKIIKISKIGSMILLIIILTIIILNMVPLNHDEEKNSLVIQESAYNYIPGDSVDEKSTYVLNHFSINGSDDITYDEYINWIKKSDVNIESNLNTLNNLFEYYDENDDDLLDRNEIKTFLSKAESSIQS